MLNLNKVQALQSRQYFDSNVLGKSTIDRSLTVFEDYRTQELSPGKLKGKVKLNLGIAYFAALSVLLFILLS